MSTRKKPSRRGAALANGAALSSQPASAAGAGAGASWSGVADGAPPPVAITYYVDVLSSWCLWAAPAWRELRARFAGRVAFDWRVALIKPEDFSASPAQAEWFYRRSGPIVGSPTMLKTGWMEVGRPERYVTPNLVAEAAREFLPPADDRAWLALMEAGLRDGQRIGDLATALRVVARATGLPEKTLRAAAESAAVRARVEASTAEFHAHRIGQRPAFILTSEIGDKVVFSGTWRAAPLATALESLLADAAAYASHRAHHGTPPAA